MLDSLFTEVHTKEQHHRHPLDDAVVPLPLITQKLDFNSPSLTF